MIFIDDLDKIAFFEDGSDIIYLMNPDNGQINAK